MLTTPASHAILDGLMMLSHRFFSPTCQYRVVGDPIPVCPSSRNYSPLSPTSVCTSAKSFAMIIRANIQSRLI